jgi:two-component sensor histidine kinase
MSSPTVEENGFAKGVGRVASGLRQAFISYARWLDSISWKRFALLSLLAMIAAGVLGELPPFRRHTVTEVVTTAPNKPVSKAPIVIQGAGKNGKKGRAYDINIDRDGVHITPAKPSAAPSAPAASSASTAPAAAADDDAAEPPSRPTAPVPPVPPVAPRPSISANDGGVHIRLPENADTEEIKRAIEEAQAEIEDAIGETKTRTHTEGGVDLPQFTFLLIVLSVVTKIMAAGRFKAEAKAVVATEIAESEALKRQVVEARMAAMQAQVEPHFLFNTLASIDHLIETDPARASQMQKNLIALLRASMPAMREAHPTAHNLGREMAVIKPYLEILKVRMEDRLQTRIDVPEGLHSADFPSMMIQSLVENAIKHGLEPKPEGGTLTVRAEIVHGKLAVTVADTGLGFGKAATAGTGTGLANIRERLKLLYGNKASMVVTENAPTGTLVTLTVPYQVQSNAGEATT